MADQDPTPVTSDDVPSGPRMEYDLRDIRSEYNVALGTVEQETRMPPDILRRFEAGQLVGDAHYNEVYLKNLLKSYSKALGISHQEVVKAFEQTKAGTYDGSLRRLYLEGDAPDIEPATPNEGLAPAVAALAQDKREPEPEPEVARPNEYFPKERVKSAKAAASTAKPIEKSWGLIIAGTVVGVLLIGGILWYLFSGADPEPEAVDRPVAVDTTSATASDSVAVAAQAPQSIPPAPQLGSTIAVTVVATDEPLEDFKMQVDDDARRPYWLNPGVEQTFEGSDRVIVWGEGGEGNYDNARLRLQGLEWAPREGVIYRIDRARGQALLDSLHRAQYNGAG